MGNYKGKDKGKGKDKEVDDDDDEDDDKDDDVDKATFVTGEEVIIHIAINNDISTLIDHNLLSQESNESFQTLKKTAGTPIAMFCSTPSSDYVKTHIKSRTSLPHLFKSKLTLKSLYSKDYSCVDLTGRGENIIR